MRIAAGLLVAILLSGSAVAQPRTPGQMLHARFPEVTFTEAPLSEVLEFVGQMAGTNLVVRWEELGTYGIERDTPITIRARNLRFSQVLWIILNEAAPDGTRLGYRLDADMLLITTAGQLGQDLVVQVYDVRDMLLPEIANPSFSYGRTRTVVTGGTAQVAEGAVAFQPTTGNLISGGRLEGTNPGGSIFIPRGGSIFDDNLGFGGGGAGGGEQDVGDFSDERMRQLIDVIETAIEPDSWRVNGGPGSIQPYNGLLIIRNSPLVHRQIGGAIRQP